MNTNDHMEAQAFALMVAIPAGVYRPEFRVIGQWHTGTGILCPPQPVPAQPLPPQLVMQLFINLVNTGMVHQIVKDEQGADVHMPLPTLTLALGKPPEQPESKIIVEEP